MELQAVGGGGHVKTRSYRCRNLPAVVLNDCLGMPATLSAQRSLRRQIASRLSADVFPAGYHTVELHNSL